MIYWINGAYGVGKSTIALELKKKLKKAIIYDAEEIGNAIRANYPKSLYSVLFDGYLLWRETNYKLLKDIQSKYNGDIIVPITLIKEESYEEIINKLKNDSIPLTHILLEADYETIHDCILNRGEEENCWCMKNINMCFNTFKKVTNAIRINTINKTPKEIVKEIIIKCIQ